MDVRIAVDSGSHGHRLFNNLEAAQEHIGQALFEGSWVLARVVEARVDLDGQMYEDSHIGEPLSNESHPDHCLGDCCVTRENMDARIALSAARHEEPT